MSSRIKVLVVDDAVVVRRLVADLLARDSGIEVVGTAATGRIALQKLTQLQPDVVTLDVDMPDMDGLETLRAIRKTHPALPVIMFSALTARAAAATLDALAFGASDYLCKPTALRADDALGMDLVGELALKIRALCGRGAASSSERRATPSNAAASPWRPGEFTSPVSVVAIGVSTGGPKALATIVPALPKNLGVPVVVVQHMPPMFTKLLACRLDAQSALRVVEAQGGESLQAGHVYIAPGSFHLRCDRLNRDVIVRLDSGAPENSCRPSVDVLFRSIAAAFGPRALGVVLTGMGQDGLNGAAALVRSGSRVIVQDQETCVVWGMPGLIAKAGLADRVLPLQDIPAEILRRTSPDAVGSRTPAHRSLV